MILRMYMVWTEVHGQPSQLLAHVDYMVHGTWYMDSKIDVGW